MKNEKILVGNPIVYYAIALFLGSFSFTIFYETVIIFVVFTTIFFLFIYFTIDIKFSNIIVLFYILGYFFNIFYFSYNLPKKHSELVVDITYDRGFFKRGALDGRYVNLLGCNKELKKGDKVYIKGDFERNIDISAGVIGEIKVNSSRKIGESRLIKINNIKDKMYKEFNSILGEENTSILMALAFGEEDYISLEDKEDLKTLGVVHAISVSGFHMVIIFKILDFIPMLGIKSFIAFLYVIFTGGKPSTLRAFLMILILKLSPKLFKNYSVLGALSFSSLLILSIRPYYVVNPGFVLSYLSVIGIILFNKKISKKLYVLPKYLRESLSLTLSSQSLSALYSIVLFKEYSLGGFLGNIFLIPIYSILVILGNIALICRMVTPLFNFICYTILSLMEGYNIVKKVLLLIVPSNIKLDYFHVISIVILFISYILIKKGYKYAKFSTISILIFYFLSTFSFTPEIHFYNLGHKECAIIKYKWDKIAICKDLDDLKRIKEVVDKSFIIDNGTTEEISLNNYFIKGKTNKAWGDNLVIEVNSEKNNSVISTLPQKPLKNFYNNCKIIEVKGKKLYNNYGKVYAKLYLIE